MKEGFIQKNKLTVLKKSFFQNQSSQNSNFASNSTGRDFIADIHSKGSTRSKLPYYYGSSALNDSKSSNESIEAFFDDGRETYDLKTEVRIIEDEDIKSRREFTKKKEKTSSTTKLSEYLLKHASPSSNQYKNSSTSFNTPNVVYREDRNNEEYYRYEEPGYGQKSKLLLISNDSNKYNKDSKNTSINKKDNKSKVEYEAVSYYYNFNNGSKLISLPRKQEQEDPRRKRLDGGIVCLRGALPNKTHNSKSPIIYRTGIKRVFNSYNFNKMRNKYIVRIQRWFRNYIPMKRERNYSSIRIQTYWRGYILRQRISKIFDVFTKFEIMINLLNNLGRKMLYYHLTNIEWSPREKKFHNILKIKSSYMKEKRKKYFIKWSKKVILVGLQKRINIRRFKAKFSKLLNNFEKKTLKKCFKSWFESLKIMENFNFELMKSNTSPKKIIKKKVEYDNDNLIIVENFPNYYPFNNEINYKCTRLVKKKEFKIIKKYFKYWQNLSKKVLKIYLNLSAVKENLKCSESNIEEDFNEKKKSYIKDYYQSYILKEKKDTQKCLNSLIKKIENNLSQKIKNIFRKWSVISKVTYERNINSKLKRTIFKKSFYPLLKKKEIIMIKLIFSKWKKIGEIGKYFFNSLNSFICKILIKELIVKVKNNLMSKNILSNIKNYFKLQDKSCFNKLALKYIYHWKKVKDYKKLHNNILNKILLKFLRKNEIVKKNVYFSLWRNVINSMNKKFKNIMKFNDKITQITQKNLFMKFVYRLRKNNLLKPNYQEIKNTFLNLHTLSLKKEIIDTFNLVSKVFNTRKNIFFFRTKILEKCIHKNSFKNKNQIKNTRFSKWKKVFSASEAFKDLVNKLYRLLLNYNFYLMKKRIEDRSTFNKLKMIFKTIFIKIEFSFLCKNFFKLKTINNRIKNKNSEIKNVINQIISKNNIKTIKSYFGNYRNVIIKFNNNRLNLLKKLVSVIDNLKKQTFLELMKMMYINLLRKSIFVKIDKINNFKKIRRNFSSFHLKTEKSKLLHKIKNILSKIIFNSYQKLQKKVILKSLTKWNSINSITNKSLYLINTITKLFSSKTLHLLKIFKLVRLDKITLDMVNKKQKSKVLKQYLINQLSRLNAKNNTLKDIFIKFRDNTLIVNTTLKKSLELLKKNIRKRYLHIFFNILFNIKLDILNKAKLWNMILFINKNTIYKSIRKSFRFWINIVNKLKYMQHLKNNYIKHSLINIDKNRLRSWFNIWEKKCLLSVVNLKKNNEFFLKCLNKIFRKKVQLDFIKKLRDIIDLERIMNDFSKIFENICLSHYFSVIINYSNSIRKKQKLESIMLKKFLNELVIENRKKSMSLNFIKWTNLLKVECQKELRSQREKKIAFNMISKVKNKLLFLFYYKAFSKWNKSVLLKNEKEKLEKIKILFSILNKAFKLSCFTAVINILLESRLKRVLINAINKLNIITYRIFLNALTNKIKSNQRINKLISIRRKSEIYDKETTLRRYFFRFQLLINKRVFKEREQQSNIGKGSEIIINLHKNQVYNRLKRFIYLMKHTSLAFKYLRKLVSRNDQNFNRNRLKVYLNKLKDLKSKYNISALKGSLIFQKRFSYKIMKIKQNYFKKWYNYKKKFDDKIAFLMKIFNKFSLNILKNIGNRIFIMTKQIRKDDILLPKILISKFRKFEQNKQKNIKKIYLSKWKKISKIFNNLMSCFLQTVFHNIIDKFKHQDKSNKKSQYILKSIRKRNNTERIIYSFEIKKRFLKWRGAVKDLLINKIKTIISNKTSRHFLKRTLECYLKSQLRYYLSKIKYFISIAYALKRLDKIIKNQFSYNAFCNISLTQYKKTLTKKQKRIISSILNKEKTTILKNYFQIWRLNHVNYLFSEKLRKRVLKYLIVNSSVLKNKDILTRVFRKWFYLFSNNISKEITFQINRTIPCFALSNNRFSIQQRVNIANNKHIRRMMKVLIYTKSRLRLLQGFIKFFKNTNSLFKNRVILKVLSKKEDRENLIKKLAFLKIKRNVIEQKHRESINFIKSKFFKYISLNNMKKILHSEEEFLNHFNDFHGHNSYLNNTLVNRDHILNSKRVMLLYLFYKEERKNLLMLKRGFFKWLKRDLLSNQHKVLPNNCKLLLNKLINDNKLNDYEYIRSNLQNHPVENKEAILTSFCISYLILKVKNYIKKITFSRGNQTNISCFHLSSLLFDNSHEELGVIDKILVLQRNWRKYLQSKYISNYAVKLKLFSKIFKTRDYSKKDKLIVSIIKWKKYCVIGILTQARNTIRRIVGNKLKIVKARRKLIASQLIQNLFTSFYVLRVVKTYFKDFVQSYVCEKGSKILKNYIKRFTLMNLFYFCQLDRSLNKKKINSMRQHFSLFDDKSLKNNRIAIKIKLNLAVSCIQNKYRLFQKLKHKALAFNKTKSIISVFEDRLAKVDYTAYLRVWRRRNLYLKKMEEENVIYKFFEKMEQLKKIKKLILENFKKVKLRELFSFVKTMQYNFKSKRFVKRLMKIIYLKKVFKLLKKYWILKRTLENCRDRNSDFYSNAAKKRLNHWRKSSKYMKRVEKYNPSVTFLYYSVNQYMGIKNKQNFWKRFNNYIGYRMVCINFGYCLTENENNLSLERFLKKLFRLYTLKIVSRIYKRKLKIVFDNIFEYLNEEKIHTDKTRKEENENKII